MAIHVSQRFPLAHLPTPLEPMERLSKALGGPEIWIKRDDQTGLATGGNKTRKLEFLIGEARTLEARVVLTVGAVQSNHCRQTAAAAARAGLDCVLVLRGDPPPPELWTGNLFLDELLGARLVWSGTEDPLLVLEQAAEAEEAAGRKPYVIPYGGSNATGAAAYALAFEELWDQMYVARLSFDRVLFATSSGGTQAGLVVGARACAFEGQVLGISVDKTGGQLGRTVLDLLAPTARWLGMDLHLGAADVHIEDRFLGAGYAVVTGAEREAVRLLARTEGILLDPVYTGKAMAGLIGLVRDGTIAAYERVLFWHTGGTPALFAYVDELKAGA
ncbi:MAG: D-cysteine desulfhydrase family protein [Chloroflexi bacterium]|nr:MAG: D-cysteine desulfhydrase family protein [Chloroflexota bacterium]